MINLLARSLVLLLPRSQGLSTHSRVLLAVAQQVDQLTPYGFSSQEVQQSKTNPTIVHFATHDSCWAQFQGPWRVRRYEKSSAEV